MTIAYRTKSTDVIGVNNSSGDYTVNTVPSPVVGELLLIHLFIEANRTPSTPAGWTLALRTAQAAGGFTPKATIATFWKYATASEPSTVTITGGTPSSDIYLGTMTAWSNPAVSGPINAVAGQATPYTGNASQNVTAPTVTPTVTGGVVLRIYQAYASSDTSPGMTLTYPGSITARVNMTQGLFDRSGGGEASTLSQSGVATGALSATAHPNLAVDWEATAQTIVLASAINYRSEVLADSPVGYWRLGEASGTTADDQTTNALDLTYGGAVTLGVPGVVSENTAASFNRGSQYATRAGVALPATGDTFSVELWVKPLVAPTSAGNEIGLASHTNRWQMYIANSNGAVFFNNGGVYDLHSSANITDTNFHHIVVTKSGATAKLYIDGVDRTVVGANATISSTSGAFNVANSFSNNYSRAILDEVAYYPTALSAARVLAHYNAAALAPWADFTYSPAALVATFTDNSTDPQNNIASRLWDFGDGATSTSTNPTHTYASSGTYNVTLTVTDATSYTGSVTKPVTVTSAVNLPPVADFSYVTSGLGATFTDASSDPDGTIVSRLWDFGDGATSTATNPTHTYAVAGTYEAILAVTDDDSATDSQANFVTVFAPETPEVTGAASGYLRRHVFARKTTLAAGIGAADPSLEIPDLTYWPTSGTLLVGGEDGEKITYNGKGAPNGTGSLLGLARGQFGTTAASHSSGDEVGLVGRHDGGVSTKRQIPVLPTDGSLTLQELRRHEDGSRFAWVDFDNYKERVEMTVTGAPFASGNVSTTFDEGGTAVTRNTVVNAAHETIDLVINNAQTALGAVTVSLDGVSKDVSLAMGLQVVQIRVQRGNYPLARVDRTFAGNDEITFLDASGYITKINVYIPWGASKEEVAARIRATSVATWTASGSGDTVIFTSTIAGRRGSDQYSYLPYHFAYSGIMVDSDTLTEYDLTLVRPGRNNLTAAEVANELRVASYPGWTTSGSGTTVTWTHDTPGNLTGTHQYNPNATGATSTSGMSVTNGSRDSASVVAAAIRATYAGNAYWAVGGVGITVTWTASAAGLRSDATWTPNATGLDARMFTKYQGSADVVAFAKDSAGNQQKHRVLANITTSTVFNIETAVSGAGTENGIVSVWGSFGTDAKILLRRFEELDLSQYTLGQMAYGAASESSDAITWEVRTDRVAVTDRGETYYRDHNSIGQLIRHGYGYFDLGVEQATSDAFVQNLRQPVRPGQQITLGAYSRWDGIPASLPAKPFYVTLRHADGTITEVGDVTGTSGISGTGDWQHFARTFTVPDAAPAVYEFAVASRDVSSGEIVFQELVPSIGASVKRTRLYAPSGVARATYEVAAPLPVDYLSLGRRRTELEALYAPEPDATVSARYRAAQDAASLGSATWHSDPLLAPDLAVVDTEVTMNGDGLLTPRLLATYPRLEYEVLVGLKAHPVLLTALREELAGGVLLGKYEEWYQDTGIAPRVLPSGRIRLQKTHNPVGYVPVLSFVAVRPEAMRYIQENWGTVEFVVEAYGKALTLKLAAKPEFSRQATPSTGSNGDRRGYWLSKEVPAEVTAVVTTAGSP